MSEAVREVFALIAVELRRRAEEHLAAGDAQAALELVEEAARARRLAAAWPTAESRRRVREALAAGYSICDALWYGAGRTPPRGPGPWGAA